MNEPPFTEPADGRTEQRSSAEELESIRELLFGPEKKQLDNLQERIEDPRLHAQDVSQVLPQAVSLSLAKDGKLPFVLAPAVEFALKESIKRDPSILVNVIFPIIGPAIRRSISETFAKLVQSLNQTLEHSFSSQGLKWRLEAARAGKSFAEVVLAHTLLYRVEQIFLIHKQTGLLLLHLTAPEVRSGDADMVSGMLTAIQDFARDSFRVAEGEALNTLHIGELQVWVESSPLVTLAAVIRGNAPYEFRTQLQSALEKVHAEQASALESFTGDAAPFELSRPHLEGCLQTRFTTLRKGKSSAKLPIICGVVLLLLLVWVGLSRREKRRWASYLDRVKSEPGIVVTEAGKRSGQYYLAGLRDPLAIDPAALAPLFHLRPEKVTNHWEPYQALSPELVFKRAVALLQPPASVTLQVQDGVLTARGAASPTWIERARTKAAVLPGIRVYEDGELKDETESLLASGQKEVEQSSIFFGDAARLLPGQDDALDKLARQLNELADLARRGNRRLQVSVVGHSDKTGSEELNLRLSRQRAEYVTSLLVARGVPTAVLNVSGIAAHEPVRADLSEQGQLKNRRVTFHVAFDPAIAP